MLSSFNHFIYRRIKKSTPYWENHTLFHPPNILLNFYYYCFIFIFLYHKTSSKTSKRFSPFQASVAAGVQNFKSITVEKQIQVISTNFSHFNIHTFYGQFIYHKIINKHRIHIFHWISNSLYACSSWISSRCHDLCIQSECSQSGIYKYF